MKLTNVGKILEKVVGIAHHLALIREIKKLIVKHDFVSINYIFREVNISDDALPNVGDALLMIFMCSLRFRVFYVNLSRGC